MLPRRSCNSAYRGGHELPINLGGSFGIPYWPIEGSSYSTLLEFEASTPHSFV
jgi:hypothetical protein